MRCVAVHVALHRNPSQAILHSDEKHPPSLHLMATLCERRAELRQCEACLRCEPPVRCIATAAAPVRPAIGIPFKRPVRVLTRARDRSRPSASRSRACSKAIEVDPKYTPALVSLADLMHYSKKSVPRYRCTPDSDPSQQPLADSSEALLPRTGTRPHSASSTLSRRSSTSSRSRTTTSASMR